MPIRLGQLEIHAELNEIAGPSGRQRLEPQAVTVLELLAREPGRVWSREELLDQAWKARVVSDATLTGVISRLRRALALAGIADVCIETRSKRGYVLVLSEMRTASARRRPVSFAVAGLIAIAVLGSVAVGVLPGLRQPELESLEGVRLDFDITFPDGVESGPVLWLTDGADGEIRLDGAHPLAIRVLPEIVDGSTLRLKFEATGLSHWTGFEQVIALDTESRFTLRSETPGSRYDIRFVASLDKPPSRPQKTPR